MTGKTAVKIKVTAYQIGTQTSNGRMKIDYEVIRWTLFIRW